MGGGRTAVWMHPGASLVFKFSGGKAPALNRAWLEALMHTANSSSGLSVVPEHAESIAEQSSLLTYATKPGLLVADTPTGRSQPPAAQGTRAARRRCATDGFRTTRDDGQSSGVCSDLVPL